jgi:hypothetical protein
VSLAPASTNGGGYSCARCDRPVSALGAAPWIKRGMPVQCSACEARAFEQLAAASGAGT